MSAHGTYSRYTQGCRCDECREAVRLYSRRRRGGVSWAEYVAAQRARVKHGTCQMYKKYRCRCDECRAWATARRARSRVRQRANVPGHVHGTINGYTNYACRCQACKAENRIYNQAKYRRKVAAT